MKVHPKITEMTEKYIDSAKSFVKGYQYMKVKRLAEGLKIPNSIAGCLFLALGWKPVNPNPRKANKTYEDPTFVFVKSKSAGQRN